MFIAQLFSFFHFQAPSQAPQIVAKNIPSSSILLSYPSVPSSYFARRANDDEGSETDTNSRWTVKDKDGVL